MPAIVRADLAHLSTAEQDRIIDESEARQNVIDAFNEAYNKFKTHVEARIADPTTPDPEKKLLQWQLQSIENAVRGSSHTTAPDFAAGQDRYKNRINMGGGATREQEEGVPVEHIIQFLRAEIAAGRDITDNQDLLDTLTPNAETYEAAHSVTLRKAPDGTAESALKEARLEQEADFIYRTTGEGGFRRDAGNQTQEGDWEQALQALEARLELKLPPLPVVPPAPAPSPTPVTPTPVTPTPVTPTPVTPTPVTPTPVTPTPVTPTPVTPTPTPTPAPAPITPPPVPLSELTNITVGAAGELVRKKARAQVVADEQERLDDDLPDNMSTNFFKRALEVTWHRVKRPDRILVRAWRANNRKGREESQRMRLVRAAQEANMTPGSVDLTTQAGQRVMEFIRGAREGANAGARRISEGNDIFGEQVTALPIGSELRQRIIDIQYEVYNRVRAIKYPAAGTGTALAETQREQLETFVQQQLQEYLFTQGHRNDPEARQFFGRSLDRLGGRQGLLFGSTILEAAENIADDGRLMAWSKARWDADFNVTTFAARWGDQSEVKLGFWDTLAQASERVGLGHLVNPTTVNIAVTASQFITKSTIGLVRSRSVQLAAVMAGGSALTVATGGVAPLLIGAGISAVVAARRASLDVKRNIRETAAQMEADEKLKAGDKSKVRQKYEKIIATGQAKQSELVGGGGQDLADTLHRSRESITDLVARAETGDANALDALARRWAEITARVDFPASRTRRTGVWPFRRSTPDVQGVGAVRFTGGQLIDISRTELLHQRLIVQRTLVGQNWAGIGAFAGRTNREIAQEIRQEMRAGTNYIGVAEGNLILTARDQERSFRNAALAESARAFAQAGITSLVFGAVGQEAAAVIRRGLGENIQQTILEKPINWLATHLFNRPEFAAAPINLQDRLQTLMNNPTQDIHLGGTFNAEIVDRAKGLVRIHDSTGHEITGTLGVDATGHYTVSNLNIPGGDKIDYGKWNTALNAIGLKSTLNDKVTQLPSAMGQLKQAIDTGTPQNLNIGAMTTTVHPNGQVDFPGNVHGFMNPADGSINFENTDNIPKDAFVKIQQQFEAAGIGLPEVATGGSVVEQVLSIDPTTLLSEGVARVEVPQSSWLPHAFRNVIASPNGNELTLYRSMRHLTNGVQFGGLIPSHLRGVPAFHDLILEKLLAGSGPVGHQDMGYLVELTGGKQILLAAKDAAGGADLPAQLVDAQGNLHGVKMVVAVLLEQNGHVVPASEIVKKGGNLAGVTVHDMAAIFSNPDNPSSPARHFAKAFMPDSATQHTFSLDAVTPDVSDMTAQVTPIGTRRRESVDALSKAEERTTTVRPPPTPRPPVTPPAPVGPTPPTPPISPVGTPGAVAPGIIGAAPAAPAPAPAAPAPAPAAPVRHQQPQLRHQQPQLRHQQPQLRHQQPQLRQVLLYRLRPQPL
ncbi:hypothetical protein A2631_00935 [Candidatus Daviesbacteria bacterium RIFCSPHIGHO2_01_FULL_44_29]|nr:MAG: hypothetical protein A2631_00935 [Candidatus Daviesbacteria bacterium RIFCSPHIGHO2_01_FULL_44_29]